MFDFGFVPRRGLSILAPRKKGSVPFFGEAFEFLGVFLELAEEFGHPGFEGMNFFHQLKMALEAGKGSMSNHEKIVERGGSSDKQKSQNSKKCHTRLEVS